jgi:hypothetical protein
LNGVAISNENTRFLSSNAWHHLCTANDRKIIENIEQQKIGLFTSG